MTVFGIKKDSRFVKDFSEGREFTCSFKFAEKYTDKKSAVIAAQEYGRVNGKGYTVVKLF